jgi:hypothetical protein
MRRSFSDGANIVVLLGAEAQQGGDVSDFIELGIVVDVKQFNVMADHARQDGFGYVYNLTRLAAADWTEAHQMSVEVAAAGALDSLGVIALAKQQRLHFAGLEGAQHAAQSSDPAAPAAGLGESFAKRFCTTLLLRDCENSSGLGTDFVAAYVGNLGGETTQ